jgi:hypothetical protein
LKWHDSGNLSLKQVINILMGKRRSKRDCVVQLYFVVVLSQQGHTGNFLFLGVGGELQFILN